MPRDNFMQLPSGSELTDIMAREAFRPIPDAKLNTHYAEFTAIMELLTCFSMPVTLFTRDFAADEAGRILELSTPLLADLNAKILADTDNAAITPLLDACYDYLSEEDNLQKADFIFVFGAKTNARIEKAVEIFQQGLAPKLIISGGNPNYGQDNVQTEAERYKQIAIENGVPEDCIILEPNSITLADNVRTSLNLIESRKLSYSRLILVNSPYVQRRGWAFFNKFTENTEFVRVNSGTLEKFSREKWYTNEDGLKAVLNEFVKLKVAVTLNSA